MVCAAVPALGGATAPSLARPMLVSANLAFLSGRRVEAAARLREALRRHLAALAAGYRLVDEGDAHELLERLRAAGVVVSGLVAGFLADIDDVLALRDDGRELRHALELAFDLIGGDDRQGGGA